MYSRRTVAFLEKQTVASRELCYLLSGRSSVVCGLGNSVCLSFNSFALNDDSASFRAISHVNVCTFKFLLYLNLNAQKCCHRALSNELGHYFGSL